MKLLILLASLASLFLFIEFFSGKRRTRFKVGGNTLKGSNYTVAGKDKVINPSASTYDPIYHYIRD